MRQLAVLAMLVFVVGFAHAENDGPVKCKADGLHLCCGNCEKSVRSVLAKVEGVSEVKVDRNATDKVTFEAKTDKVAADAMAALVKGGFCCEIAAGDKKVLPEKVMVKVKGDQLVVKDVHLCCNACINGVKALFKEDTITVTGKGAQRDMLISGKSLDGQVVLDTMRRAGFTGLVEEKK